MDFIEDYIEKLERKGRKETSLRTYRSVLKNIIVRIGKDDPKEIDEDDVKKIIDSGMSENSKKYYYELLSTWCAHYGNDRVKKMELLWNDTVPEVKWISVDEFDKMMSAAVDAKERLILGLLCYAGMRSCEVANLKISDITDKSITIHGKGHGTDGKIRTIPMTDRIGKLITDYEDMKTLTIWKHDDKSNGSLIIRYLNDSYAEITPAYVQNKVRNIAKRAGVNASSHSFRRLFATEISKKADIRTVQVLMGHTNINTTARYIYRNDEILKQAMESF